MRLAAVDKELLDSWLEEYKDWVGWKLKNDPSNMNGPSIYAEAKASSQSRIETLEKILWEGHLLFGEFLAGYNITPSAKAWLANYQNVLDGYTPPEKIKAAPELLELPINCYINKLGDIHFSSEPPDPSYWQKIKFIDGKFYREV